MNHDSGTTILGKKRPTLKPVQGSIEIDLSSRTHPQLRLIYLLSVALSQQLPFLIDRRLRLSQNQLITQCRTSLVSPLQPRFLGISNQSPQPSFCPRLARVLKIMGARHLGPLGQKRGNKRRNWIKRCAETLLALYTEWVTSVISDSNLIYHIHECCV